MQFEGKWIVTNYDFSITNGELFLTFVGEAPPNRSEILRDICEKLNKEVSDDTS